jgi:Protein of unknown function (DUF1592)/Protein of unknown function (DUF1588)/Protein of unknown function (DUF1585)/Cytochrome C oxidase, cbb3-type, subunit III
VKAVRALLAMSFLCGSAVANPADLAEVVRTYCVPCHNARLAESKIALDALDSGRPWAEPEVWERVLRQLRARTMPPMDNPRPDPMTYEALVAALGSSLDRGGQKAGAAPPRVTDVELATRLASFLWSSAPDAALIEAARKGRLHDPAVLDAQVRRMLADTKVAGLVRGFFDAWLGLNQVATMPADSAAFPELDSELRRALLRETELDLESQLREDRPAMELWTANYTYVNDRLARYYGIQNVFGPEFRRVPLPGSERAGLLGQGSFLIATSVLTRHAAVDAPSTSPATRAKWIRTHFLGVPVPHPIPGIPPLQKGVLLSAQLRTLPDPSCTACHSNFFPLGYALENFDPLGRWRTEAENEPIDVSGTLADGTEFTGPAELRAVLLERSDAFLTTITERLLAYAVAGKPGIAEPVSAERMPAVRAVLREAERKRYTWSSLFVGIADSSTFLRPRQ